MIPFFLVVKFLKKIITAPNILKKIKLKEIFIKVNIIDMKKNFASKIK